MGTGFEVDISQDQVGIIPRAIKHLFNGIDKCISEAQEKGTITPEFKIMAQFMELYNEEVIDLFNPIGDNYIKVNNNFYLTFIILHPHCFFDNIQNK